MWEEFDMAADAVKKFLELNEYAYGTRAAHLRCYKRLGAYLRENKRSYSKQTAEQWFQFEYNGLCEGEKKVFRRALNKIEAAYHHGDIGSTSAKSGMRQIYHRLAPWCKALLDDFMVKMSDAFGHDYTHAVKVSAARFLSRMVDIGISGPEYISHRIVVDYCRDGGYNKYTSELAASADKGHIKKFLQQLSEKGIVRASIHMALDQSVFSRLVFIDSLNSDDSDRLLAAAKSPDMSALSYYELATAMDPIVVQHKYAETAQHTFHIAYKELFVFLEANSLGYSAGVALLWSNIMSRYTAQWMSFRRAIMLFEQFRKNDQIDPGTVFRYMPDRVSVLPEWCRVDYEEYIKIKEKSDVAESTMDMCRSSCLRLMEYLCETGISSWGQITPEMLKTFHRQDIHSTPEGKNAYASRIRHFLEYLGEIGRVSPTMFLAIPSESSRRVSIVKTLCEADIDEIYLSLQGFCGQRCGTP